MRKKKTLKAKQPVAIRFKELANGNQSIYLDIYDDGKRTYEFLKLYLIPERTGADKNKNIATLQTAAAVQAQRIVDIQNGKFGLKGKTIKSNAKILPYIYKIADEKLERSGSKQGDYYNFRSLALHLGIFKGEKTTFKEIDADFVQGFIDYLRTAVNMNLNKNKRSKYISKNTQHKLFSKFNYVLEDAVRDSILQANPIKTIKRSTKPKMEPGTREYLTIDELKKLIKVDCRNDEVKKAFLFCCLTGLRYSDVSQLRWENVRTSENGEVELRFSMEKTEREITLQISAEAVKWLPSNPGANPGELVYHLPKNEYTNPAIKEWVRAAGINKHITFHCSRHTAATLNLTLGTRIEVVSKLLGHTKISTTQIYGKIVDEAKRDAVDKQNGIFG